MIMVRLELLEKHKIIFTFQLDICVVRKVD